MMLAGQLDAGAFMTGLVDAAREVREHGTFGYLDKSIATPQLNALLDPTTPKR